MNPTTCRALAAVSAVTAIGAAALLAHTVSKIRTIESGDILAAAFVAAGIYLIAMVLASWAAAGLVRDARYEDARAYRLAAEERTHLDEIATIRAELARSRATFDRIMAKEAAYKRAA